MPSPSHDPTGWRSQHPLPDLGSSSSRSRSFSSPSSPSPSLSSSQPPSPLRFTATTSLILWSSRRISPSTHSQRQLSSSQPSPQTRHPSLRLSPSPTSSVPNPQQGKHQHPLPGVPLLRHHRSSTSSSSPTETVDSSRTNWILPSSLSSSTETRRVGQFWRGGWRSRRARSAGRVT